ncbi:MAG: methyltransferase domain-containing protein [Chloroflexi bacterium]|nr:methyltransferase domain-containing protein [Chloroflexota bacterium]
MFSETARYYDKIYAFKDYQAEVQRLVAIVREHTHSGGNRLLDVACGTGLHVEYLKEHFDAQGLDIEDELLEFARQRNPGILFHQGDMMAFDLGRQFDVVTCLFSSIGYAKTLDNVRKAAACMARHLVTGGLLIVEPWFTPDAWHTPSVHASFIDEPDLKIARVNTSFVDGRLSYFDLHYLIGTPEGTEHFVERHELGLFETDEMQAALTDAGLHVTYDTEGLMGRGLFIGRRL